MNLIFPYTFAIAMLILAFAMSRKCYLINLNKTKLKEELNRYKLRYQNEKYIEIGCDKDTRNHIWVYILIICIFALIIFAMYLDDPGAAIFIMSIMSIAVIIVLLSRKTIGVKHIGFKDKVIALNFIDPKKENQNIHIKDTEIKYLIISSKNSESYYLYLKTNNTIRKYHIYNTGKEEFLAFVLFINLVKNFQASSSIYNADNKELLNEIKKHERRIFDMSFAAMGKPSV